MSYIPLPSGPTPAWLTAVLRESGALPTGSVAAVEARQSEAFNSDVVFLHASYTPDAPQEAPQALVLKRNRPEPWAVEAGAEETRFYQLAGSLAGHPPITITCVAAAVDEKSGNSYLLLQDLSATHRPPITRDQQVGMVEGVPHQAYIDACVDVLAQLHGFWWEHPLLAGDRFTVGYWSRDEGRLHAYLERRWASWESLLADEQEQLPQEYIRLYNGLFNGLPGFWERSLAPRFRAGRGLTLIHGDCYFANFLCPREPGAGATYLLDWQSPNVDLAGYDLANLLAAFWSSEQRHGEGRERRALERYWEKLELLRPGALSFDALLDDYRAGLIFWALVPVQDRHGGAPREYWWPKMQCLVAAFREWRCGELLGIAGL
jgi:aminoglycoside phosphotransferase (APT) family kinase protein